MKIEVLHFRWSYEDADEVVHEFEGGEREIEKPSKALLGGIAAAAACPDPPIRVVSASKDERAAMAKAVQSQEDGEKAYAEAQESGEWHDGNVTAALERQVARLKAHYDSIERGDLDGRLADDDLARTHVAHAQTIDVRRRMDDGSTFQEAAAGWHSDHAAFQEARARAGEPVGADHLIEQSKRALRVS